MKTAVEIGWPLGLGLIGFGLIWYLVEDVVRFGQGKSTSSIGPWITAAGVLCLGVMLFLPASYDPI